MRLNLSIEKIIDVIGGECELAADFFINKVASLKNAGPNDISVVFDPEEGSVFEPTSIEEVSISRAGVIIASKALVDGKNYIIVDNPLNAFNSLVKDFTKLPPSVHKSAVIDETVILDDGVHVGALTVIEKNVRIGEDTGIGAQVYIGTNVKIGNNVKIHPGVKILDRSVIGDHTIVHSGAVIGSDGFGYRVTQSGLRKISQVGIVRIGKHVEIGAGTCIDRAAFDETIIEDGVKLDNLVHIAHNVRIGKSTAIIAQTAVAGSVNIGMGCMIGGQVGIKDHVHIGNGVKIISQSGIMKNVPDGEIVAGSPSMSFSKWKRIVALTGRLPEFAKLAAEMQNKLGNRSIWSKIFKK